LCRHARNVPDDLLKMIAASGGLVMAAFLPAYLTEADRLHDQATQQEMARLTEWHAGDASRIDTAFAAWRKGHPEPHQATLLDVADHIDHIREVAGIDHVGIGSDFDGFKNPPAGLEDVSCFPALLGELQKRGYSERDLKKVAGENILRVMRAVESKAQLGIQAG
jgi:membrane dipeptidase